MAGPAAISQVNRIYASIFFFFLILFIYLFIFIFPLYTMEYYSAIKKDDIMPFAATWYLFLTMLSIPLFFLYPHLHLLVANEWYLSTTN